jgi:uncharacterized protein YecE (DUF72 family)
VSRRKPASPQQETLNLLDTSPNIIPAAEFERQKFVLGLRLGTSSFTANGWPGSFYPADLPPSDYLSYYATKFNTVEVDSTFYRTPLASTVTGWYEKTPTGFLFAAKVPHVVTHEKVLVDCEREFDEFVDRMKLLGEKLGPLLLQFPYFNTAAFKGAEEFLARLRPFLRRLQSATVRFAVEIRNKDWLAEPFLDLLREHKVALALIDQSWMPRPSKLFEKFDPITTDFTYVRWLGDRKEIERQTKTWDEVIVDRSNELQEWVKYCHQIVQRGVTVYAFANNHYAGHSPATVQLFRDLWQS